MLPVPVEVEQFLGHGQRIVAAGGGKLLQLHAGRMQQLVGQAAGQLGQHVLGRDAVAELAQGLANFLKKFLISITQHSRVRNLIIQNFKK